MEYYINLLFLDIETVPMVKDFELLDERTKHLFIKKLGHKIVEIPNQEQIVEIAGIRCTRNMSYDEKLNIIWKENAALYAEFSRVACVSMGLLSETADGLNLKLHSIINRNESTVLSELAVVLDKIPNYSLVGHNIKDFDAPFLTRRYLANRIKLPAILNIGSKKPWELTWKDTMEIWAAGQFKYKCSLDLLCNTLGVDSPKGEMDGSKVAEIFYRDVKSDELAFDVEQEAFKKITDYCEGDVRADAECYLVLVGSERKIVSTSH